MGELALGVFIGFFVCLFAIVSGLESYEKPTAWENGQIIKHKDKVFRLVELKVIYSDREMGSEEEQCQS